jgi:hypothetical protein
LFPHSTRRLESRQELYSRVKLPEDDTVVFVIPMLMAFLMAVSAMIVLGVFALRESEMMTLVYEDTHEARARRTAR